MSSLQQTVPRFLRPRLSWKAVHVDPSASCWTMQHQQLPPAQSLLAVLAHRGLGAAAALPMAAPAASRMLCTQTSQAGLRRRLPFQPLAALVPLAWSPSPSPSPSPTSLPLSRSFHASAVRARDHHYDTLKFVQRLQREGFTEDQSVAMMKVLNDVIEESIQNLTRTMVLREDAAKATYTQKVDFAKLRSELLSADSTEGNTTKSAHERLANDIAKFNSRLRDEVARTQASVRLDLNLEKGADPGGGGGPGAQDQGNRDQDRTRSGDAAAAAGAGQIPDAAVAHGRVHGFCGPDAGCLAVVHVKGRHCDLQGVWIYN